MSSFAGHPLFTSCPGRLGGLNKFVKMSCFGCDGNVLNELAATGSFVPDDLKVPTRVVP